MEDIVDIVLAIIFIVVPIIIGKATKKNGKQGQQQRQQVQQRTAVPPNSMRQDDRMPMPVAQRNNASHQRTMYQQVNVAQPKSVNQYSASKKNISIVEKAKMNNAKLAQDETLKEIETLHSHQEKHEAEKVQHSAACQTLKTDADAILAEESVLGTIDELMAKGYSGNLNFDRDFVGEAMDMISSFTVPDMVPDYEMPGSDV